MASPDFTQPFIMQMDASSVSLGAVRAQAIHREELPIVYLSQKLSPTEQKYSTIKREALAVKHSSSI